MDEVKEESAQWVVFDAEGDGLLPTKFYCLSYEDYLGNKGTITNYERIRHFFTEYEVYVGHNIKRWDLIELERVVGIEVPKSVVDTLAISWYLRPDRHIHGIESYGEDFGIPKPIIKDWHNLDLQDYIHRCETDVQINVALWKSQLHYLNEIYDDPSDLWRFLRYLDVKMTAAVLAEQSGWKLDIEKCKSNLQELLEKREVAVNELRLAMPRVPTIQYRKPPARRHKADGSLSVLGERWEALLVERGLPLDYDGVVEEVIGSEPGNPASHVQLKDWLYSLGWVPQTIKYQRDKKTGQIKEIPQIYTEHEKEICESIQKLFDKEPALRLLDGLGVLNHRISILNGFLRDVDEKGYLHARVAGFTNTLRFKHAEIVNLPKPEKPYGEYIRGVLVAPDGYELCGSDMSSLEDRLKQHFIYPFDPDYVRELNTVGYDPHLDIAVIAGMMTKEQADAYKAGDHSLKPIRSIAKNGNYACQYGAGVARLMITCGIDREAAQVLHEAYWKRNWSIKAVAESQIIKTIDGQMWLYNPISGFWYSLRTEKDIFSTLVQGSASYCFDLWVKVVLEDRPQITGQFHDEFILCVEQGFSSYNKETKKWEGPIVEWLHETIKTVNELLELNRELGIDVQFGLRYSEIH